MSISMYMVLLIMAVLAMSVVSQIKLVKDMLIAAGVNTGDFFIGGIIIIVLFVTIAFALTQR